MSGLRLRRHILAEGALVDPYSRVAADLNRDGNINVLDLIQLQGIILGNEFYYPKAGSWRFINSTWDGRGAPVESIPVTSIISCAGGHDFIGVRLGDLNGSAGAGAGARLVVEEPE